jgi:hypothetical protein
MISCGGNFLMILRHFIQLFNQVFRRLRYVGGRTGVWADGRAGVNNFFCAQLLLHFSTDFDQTFTEALSSSALAHIVGVLRLDNI